VSEPPTGDDVTGALTRLEQEMTALHDEVRRLGATSALPAATIDVAPPPASYAWVGSFDISARRRPQVPRLLLEGLFLAAAAAAAAIADLDAVAIGGVMVGAWVLVALIEWAASRADRQPEIPVYAGAAVAPAGADPAWFSPPVEQTLLDAAAGDNVTEVTRLPPPLDDVESTVAGSVRPASVPPGSVPPGSVPAGD
jgi:hypothetical protein